MTRDIDLYRQDYTLSGEEYMLGYVDEDTKIVFKFQKDTVQEVAEEFKRFLLAVGFMPKTVAKIQVEGHE